jgi:DNA-binding beta-propeller fold protein YncE
MKTWHFAVGTLFLAIFFLSIPHPGSLQASPQNPVTGSTDVVRIIHNKAGNLRGPALGITINLVRKIGDINTEDEHCAFRYPSDIAVDASGNIYVLDSGNARIQEFTADGKYLATIGRHGQGPGEFMLPDGLDIDRKGGLIVSDAAQLRIQAFPSKESEDIAFVRLEGSSFRGIRVLASGDYVSSTSSLFDPEVSGTGQRLNEARLLKILSPAGQVLNAFGRGIDFGDSQMNAKGNACAFDVDQRDNIYLCFIFQNRLEKYGPNGKLIWRADRPLSYDTGAKTAKMNACSTGIAADTKGRTWVVTYARQLEENVETVQTMMLGLVKRGSAAVNRFITTSGDTDLRSTDAFKLEIFSADGELLGEIPLTHFADVIRIHQESLFIIDRDHGSTIYIYRIVE